MFRHVEGLSDYLLARGWLVHLAYSSVRSSDRSLRLVDRIVSAGGRTLDLRTGNRPSFRDIRALKVLRRFAQETGVQIIHGHSFKAGSLARLLPLLGVQAELFYTPNAYYKMHTPEARDARFALRVEKYLGSVGKTIAVSEDERNFAIGTLGVNAKRTVHIPNAVNSGTFIPAPPEIIRKRRLKLFLDPDKLVIGSIGRLSSQKDPVTLYNALAPIFRENPVLQLLHLGEGELEPEVNRIIRELGIRNRVTRCTYLSDPSVFYQAIDAMILTSRYEGLSLAVIEALASNLPLILSEAPGNRDFLRLPLSHTWSAAPGNAAGFTNAVRAWLADRPRARPCNHRQIAIERFSPEVCYGAIMTEYEQAMRNNAI